MSVNKSKCCNSKIDYGGGGYTGKYIHPIETYCTECDQLLEINGLEVDDIRNPITGKLIK